MEASIIEKRRLLDPRTASPDHELTSCEQPGDFVSRIKLIETQSPSGV
jgi:hypothetical protein